MASALASWWMQISSQTHTLGVRVRSRASASVSLVLGLALLFGTTSLARSRAGDVPRMSTDAALVVLTPALHSAAHRAAADPSFARRWPAPLDLAHPARAVSLHARIINAAARVPSWNDAPYSGVAARGYDATAPPGSMG